MDKQQACEQAQQLHDTHQQWVVKMISATDTVDTIANCPDSQAQQLDH